MKSLDFKTAFKFPFNRAKGMWNILWIFLPIFGWLALGGYSVRIIQGFTKGKFKELPVMKFSEDMKLGFFMFLKSLPFVIAYTIIFAVLVSLSPWFNFLKALVDIFAVPLLAINFIKKETVAGFFEFKIVKVVLDNIGDYLIALLKSIALGLIFLVMWIVLVGIPAGSFTQNIFLADFYRRRVK